MTYRDCSSVSYLLHLFVLSALDSELLEDKDSAVHIFIFINSMEPLGTNLILNEMFFE